MADEDSAMNPQENPTGTGHLPVSGEVGNGPVSYHDPVTQPTDDDVSASDDLGDDTVDIPGPEQPDDDPTPGTGGTAGLS